MKIVRQLRPRYLAIGAILLYFFLAMNSMVMDSPTMDEQNHIARGVAFLASGDPRFSLEHPPLLNLISGFPLVTLLDLNIPFDHSSWMQPQGWYTFAEQLLWVYNSDVGRMIFLARIPMLFVTMALAIIGYRFSDELWGKPAGIVALSLLLFDPNIIANGRYVTTDVGAATFILLGAYSIWKTWNSNGWHWHQVGLLSLALGLSLGSKMSSLLFVPLFAILTIIPIHGDRRLWQGAKRRLMQLSIALIGAVFLVWAIYAFEWGKYSFQTSLLEPLNSIAGPLPTYLAGIEQIASISSGGRPVFLLGEFSTEGWWYYFPVAFLVKTPVFILLLFTLSSIALLLRIETRRRALLLIIPALLYFFISMLSSLNIGYRHLLPMLPFLYVTASGVHVLSTAKFQLLYNRSALISAVLVFVIFSIVVLDVALHPHYLSYFNRIGGGPENGHQILVDSNIDWGQDLLRLREWMDKNEVTSINLSWFGTADPQYYGINYEPLPGLPRHFDLWWDVPFDTQSPDPGIYAVSVSNLWEIPLEEKTVFSYFRDREPDDRIGYSIHIYEVDDEVSR